MEETRTCSKCGETRAVAMFYTGIERRKAELLVTSGSLDALKAEIAKCEVVCANCHRVRTRSRVHGAFGKDRVS